jgi:acetyl esterase/lipase
MAGLSLCSPLTIINALTPRGGYRLIADSAYGASPRQKLDLYLPQPIAAPAPVVVFFYGGSWQTGVKRDYRFIGQAFASRGFITIIADYRLYPEVRYPAFLEDAATVILWAHWEVPKHAGALERLFLAGHSAGAYIAAMLGLDGQWLGKVGLDTAQSIRGVLGFSGPYDFLPLHDPILKIIFGPEEDLPATQPITHARTGAPPIFLAAGTADLVVKPDNSSRLAARLRAQGNLVEEKYYPRLGHGQIAGAIAAPLRFLAPVLHDALSFMMQVP